MIILIPNWPQTAEKIPYDPMVSLTRVMDTYADKVELVFLTHHNALRQFLNQNNLSRQSVWDALDNALGIELTDGKTLSINDFDFPPNSYLIYDRYGGLVYRDKKLLMRINVNSDLGYINNVTYYLDNNKLKKYCEYDDRGFVISEQLQDDQDNLITQKWFDEYGNNILNYDGSQIVVQEIAKDRFRKRRYQSLEEVLLEVTLQHFNDNFDPRETFFVSAVNTQTKFYLEQLQNTYEINYLVNSHTLNDFDELFTGAHQLFVENEFVKKKVFNTLGPDVAAKTSIGFIYPTDLTLGKSAEQKYQKILWNIQATSVEDINKIFVEIKRWLAEHHKSALIMINVTPSLARQLALEVVKIIRLKYDFMNEIETEAIVESILDRTKVEELFRKVMQLKQDLELKQMKTWMKTVEQCLQELGRFTIKQTLGLQELNSILQESRLLIDMQEIPDQYLQVAAVSAGIPQIICSESPYVEHTKNGWLVTGTTRFSDGLDYFLVGLKRWNEALVFNVAVIAKYSSENIFAFWKGIFNGR